METANDTNPTLGMTMKTELNVQDILTGNGLRATPHRCRVLDAITRSSRPVSAREVLDAMDTESGINRVTVYRILDVLVENQVVERISSADRSFRYGLSAHIHQRPHAHFYCMNCGNMQCLEEVNLDQLPFGGELVAGPKPIFGDIADQRVGNGLNDRFAACNGDGVCEGHKTSWDEGLICLYDQLVDSLPLAARRIKEILLGDSGRVHRRETRLGRRHGRMGALSRSAALTRLRLTPKPPSPARRERGEGGVRGVVRRGRPGLDLARHTQERGSPVRDQAYANSLPRKGARRAGEGRNLRDTAGCEPADAIVLLWAIARPLSQRLSQDSLLKKSERLDKKDTRPRRLQGLQTRWRAACHR